MSLRRKRLPTTLRFEVLKRDDYTCQYCGAGKESKLTVDHIASLDAGGTNDPSNLITSCEVCNRGKSATPLNEPKIGTLRGPYYDKVKQGWALRWVENGEAKAFTSPERSVVAAKRAELAGGTAAASELPLIKRFGSATEIRAGLEQAALAANQAIRTGNMEGLLALKKYASLLSEIGSAIVPHTNYAETEEELAEAVAELERIRAGRSQDDAEKPAAIANPATTLKGGAGPDAKPSRSRDPVPN